MSSQSLEPGGAPMSNDPHDPRRKQEFDTEIKIWSVWLTAVGLAIVIAVSMLGMWWLSGNLRAGNLALDPEPSPIPEARSPRVPPGPRLQPSPEAELIEMEREYKQQLTSYGWVDRNTGVAHIPVERAIELLAAQGRLPAAITGGVSEAASPAPDTTATGAGIEVEELDSAPNAGAAPVSDAATDGGSAPGAADARDQDLE